MGNKKWTANDVLKIMAIMQMSNTDSLDRELPSNEPGEAFRIGDFVEDDRPSPQEIVEQKELRETLIKAVYELSPRQTAVIVLRYGLNDGIKRTLDEVGAMYGLTRERIRQVELKGLEKLKRILIKKYKITGEDL